MYQRMIAEAAAKQGRLDINTRHVEAWMRLEHGTLDGLSSAAFDKEVAASIACVDASGAAESESLAQSYAIR